MSKPYGAGLKYDFLHKEKNYLKETEYLIKCFSKYKGKVSNILDVGCGTGNHSNILFSKGFLQLGIDPCPTMIKIAKSKNTQGNFKCIDLNEGENNIYDASISMFNVVNHINNLQELIKFFKNISLKLKPKGILIFDCFNNVAFNRDKPLNIKKINHIIKPEFDYFNSTLNLISTSDNIPELNYDVNHRIWSVDILKEILTYNFKKINIFNHFSFTPLNENNYKITFICQK